jgi:hypothetical protein
MLQEPVLPTLANLERHGHLYGVATLPNGRRVACGTYAVREDEGPDWLSLYIPMGALSTAYEVGSYPFGTEGSSSEWRRPLDARLVEIGRAIFSETRFGLALIGHEVSGDLYFDGIATRGIPEERYFGLLLQVDGELVWYPPNNYGNDWTVDR